MVKVRNSVERFNQHKSDVIPALRVGKVPRHIRRCAVWRDVKKVVPKNRERRPCDLIARDIRAGEVNLVALVVVEKLRHDQGPRIVDVVAVGVRSIRLARASEVVAIRVSITVLVFMIFRSMNSISGHSSTTDRN